MVNGITFSEQLITSANFAHFMYIFLNMANGVTKGCGVSHANGKIYVQKGYFMEFGRMVQIIGVEEIESPDVLSGQLYCKVVFEIDLSKTNTADEFNQGYFKTLTSATEYPDVIREDLDNDGTLYQMPWCQYIKKADGISEFRDLRDILNLESIWSAVSAQNTQYKGEFDKYFAEQRAVIEQMITELQKEGYLTLETARTVRTVVMTAAGWSASAPYTQTVSTPGITAADNPVMSLHIPNGATAAQVKAWNKAFGMVDEGISGDGQSTFKCYNKKPAVDFTVAIKGV